MSLFLLLVETFLLLAGISIASQMLAIGAEALEHKFGAGFVGSVVLGFITTLPELVFVVIAAYIGATQIALGSAIGGNIMLFTLGYGLVIVLAFIYHRKFITLPKTMRDDMWYLVLSTMFIMIVATFTGMIPMWAAFILMVAYVGYVVHQFLEARNLPPKEAPNGHQASPESAEAETAAEEDDSSETSDEETDSEGEPRSDEDTHKIAEREDRGGLLGWWDGLPLSYRSGALLLVGTVILLFLAERFVHAIEHLAEEISWVTAIVLALVISPLASEMPEKISAFVLTKRSMTGAEMAVANFVGSKVQNNTLLFGMLVFAAWLGGATTGSGLATGVSVDGNFFYLMLMVLTTLIVVKFTYDLKLNVKEGIIALALYVICVVLMLVINPF